MRLLLDGYNLLYALNMARKGIDRAAWDAARQRLLLFLATQHTTARANVTVVFDAQKAAPGFLKDYDFQGLRVRYAVRQEADDLIERLVAVETRPQQLTVVSNDHRIQTAARRRGCTAWTCSAYLDWLEVQREPEPLPPPPPPVPVKPTEVSEADREFWLAAFADADRETADEQFRPRTRPLTPVPSPRSFPFRYREG